MIGYCSRKKTQEKAEREPKGTKACSPHLGALHLGICPPNDLRSEVYPVYPDPPPEAPRARPPIPHSSLSTPMEAWQTEAPNLKWLHLRTCSSSDQACQKPFCSRMIGPSAPCERRNAARSTKPSLIKSSSALEACVHDADAGAQCAARRRCDRVSMRHTSHMFVSGLSQFSFSAKVEFGRSWDFAFTEPSVEPRRVPNVLQKSDAGPGVFQDCIPAHAWTLIGDIHSFAEGHHWKRRVSFPKRTCVDAGM